MTCQRPYHVESTRSRQLPARQATSGLVSTWMGDRLGIRDAVDMSFCCQFRQVAKMPSFLKGIGQMVPREYSPVIVNEAMSRCRKKRANRQGRLESFVNGRKGGPRLKIQMSEGRSIKWSLEVSISTKGRAETG